MPTEYKKTLAIKKDVLLDLSEDTMQIIKRIDKSRNVLGVLYFRENIMELCTAPDDYAHTLSDKLPHLNSAVCRALSEIDVLDKLIAYRVATKNVEIIVAADNEFTACVIHRAKKYNQTKKLRAEIN